MRHFFLVAAICLLSLGCADHQFDNPAAPTPAPDPTVPSTLNLDATPGTGDNAGTATITATVRNAAGKPLNAITVGFSVDSGTIPASAATNVAGVAMVTLNAPAGPAKVTAKVGSTLSIFSLVAIQPTPAAPPSSPNPPAPPPPPPVVTVPLTVKLTVTPGTAGSSTLFGISTSGAVTNASWTFGDGASATGLPTVTHAYAAGVYQASVTVGGALGRSASDSVAVVIAAPPPPPAAPVPAITVKLGCVDGTSATAVTPTPTDCNVSATDQTGAIVTASITQVVWNWGDGAVQTVNGVLNQRQYLQSGAYTVFVTVTANGLTNTGSAIVTIP